MEGGACTSQGDRHTLLLDKDSCTLFELYRTAAIPASERTAAGDSAVGASADSGAIFNMASTASRPLGWTSSDAAGLPVLPGLALYEEVVVRQAIRHALRFTVRNTQRAYFAPPATHFASSSSDGTLLPMGARLRLRSSYNCAQHTQTEPRVVCQALQRYGMILADNGSDFFISGAPDPRWNDAAINAIKNIPAALFDVVDTGAALCTTADCS